MGRPGLGCGAGSGAHGPVVSWAALPRDRARAPAKEEAGLPALGWGRKKKFFSEKEKGATSQGEQTATEGGPAVAFGEGPLVCQPVGASRACQVLPSRWGGGTVKARGPGPGLCGAPAEVPCCGAGACLASTSPTDRETGGPGATGEQDTGFRCRPRPPPRPAHLPSIRPLSCHWPGLPWEEAWAINNQRKNPPDKTSRVMTASEREIN